MARDQERRFRMNIEKLEGRSLTTALGGVNPALVVIAHPTAEVRTFAFDADQKVHGQSESALDATAASNYHFNAGFFGS